VCPYISSHIKKKFFQKPTTYIKNQQKTCLIWIRCRRQQIVNKQLLITHHKKNSVKTLPINHNPRCKPNFYVYNFSYKCGPRFIILRVYYTFILKSFFKFFFPIFAKNKKEIQNESYRGHCLQRKKKGSSDITKKKQNRLFAKKKKYPP